MFHFRPNAPTVICFFVVKIFSGTETHINFFANIIIQRKFCKWTLRQVHWTQIILCAIFARKSTSWKKWITVFCHVCAGDGSTHIHVAWYSTSHNALNLNLVRLICGCVCVCVCRRYHLHTCCGPFLHAISLMWRNENVHLSNGHFSPYRLTCYAMGYHKRDLSRYHLDKLIKGLTHSEHPPHSCSRKHAVLGIVIVDDYVVPCRDP